MRSCRKIRRDDLLTTVYRGRGPESATYGVIRAADGSLLAALYFTASARDYSPSNHFGFVSCRSAVGALVVELCYGFNFNQDTCCI